MRPPRFAIWLAAMSLYGAIGMASTSRAESPTLRLNGKGESPLGLLSFTFGAGNELTLATPPKVTAARATLIEPAGSRHDLACSAEKDGTWKIALGPLLARPKITYADGLVWETGYGIEVVLLDAENAEVSKLQLQQVPGEEFRPWKYGQPISTAEGFFALNAPPVQRFNPARSSGVMVDFSLGDSVLKDNATLSVIAGLRETAPAASMEFQLLCLDVNGKEVLKKRLSVARGKASVVDSISTSEWADGAYTFHLDPVVTGKVYADGPSFTYYRDRTQTADRWISPLLPWRLVKRDGAPSLTISSFSDPSQIQIPTGWETVGTGTNQTLVSRGASEPVTIHPKLSGYYAVYLTPHDRGCLISVGGENLVRATKMSTEQFVTVADLTGQDIRIYGFDWIHKQGKQTGVKTLRFEPVTEDAKAFLSRLGQPELPLIGVDDWLEYFVGAARIHQDQIRMILRGQQELGLSEIAWSVARSWVEYYSDLPDTSRFPVKPIAEAQLSFPQALVHEGKARFLALGCPLRVALKESQNLGLPLDAWMGMNRHYGKDALGGIAASEWFVRHPEWRRWKKNATAADKSEVSYYFPEVREERLRILEEVLSIGTKHLVLDTTRQVPMLLYHPDMVAEYVRLFGRDPQKFDFKDRENYLHWIQWRAGFFTQLLRDLRVRTQKSGADPVTISVRIPATDLVTNMAMGLDVRTWLKDGLIDRLMLNPQELSSGEGLSSTAAYQELCRTSNIPLTVGIGATWMSPASLPASLRRAEGLHKAGIKALDLYEAETLAFLTDVRWATGLFGSPELLKEFYGKSNLEACWPILPETASFGLDNHSRWLKDGWSLYGSGPTSL